MKKRGQNLQINYSQESRDVSEYSDGTYLSQSQIPGQEFSYEQQMLNQSGMQQQSRSLAQNKSMRSLQRTGTASSQSPSVSSNSIMVGASTRNFAAMKKSAFSTNTVASNSRNPPKLNTEKNFIPATNLISSTELLFNSKLHNNHFTDNDSTRATALYEETYSLNDVTRLPSASLNQRLTSIMEEKAFQEEKNRKLNDPFYNYEPPPKVLQRRASEIAADSEEYMIAERSIPKVIEKTVVFSPYDITRQDELNLLIEKDRKKREIEDDYKARIQKESSTKNANDILLFLGMNQTLPTEVEDETEESNRDKDKKKDGDRKGRKDQEKKKTVVVAPSGIPVDEADKPVLGINEILKQMNSLTPQEQKIAIINSARGKAANTRANFNEEEKDTNKRKINLISDGVKKQIELDAKKAEEDAAAAALAKARAAILGRVSQSNISGIHEEDDEDGDKETDKVSRTSSKVKVPNRIDRQMLKQSFHYVNKYQSNIYSRVFDNFGKNYVSKYLSQSTFEILDGQEEDPQQTVLHTANFGQKVLLIESKPPTIKPILIKGGKFRHAMFIPEGATEEEINEAKCISTKSLRQVERLKMTIPANIESQKEKEYSRYGRRARMALIVPRSHWEEKMVEAGRRKVHFAKDYDLIQYELHQTVDTIFNDPQYFDHQDPKLPDNSKDNLVKLGENRSGFLDIDQEAPKLNAMNIDKNNKSKFFEVFDDQFAGNDNLTAFQKEWNKFESFKQKYQGEFDRLDGFKYKFKGKEAIADGIRKEEVYDKIIAEEGEKNWRPPDEPQTNPPEVLKEFQIEPNILVYSKNILDIDLNYKNKQPEKKDMRRQGRVGLAESGNQAQLVQNITDNKDPNANNELLGLNKDEEKEENGQKHVRERVGGKTLINPVQGEAGEGALSLQDSILKFQQMQNSSSLGKLASHGTILPQQRKREQFDFMYENPGTLPYAKMQKIHIAIDENEKRLVKLSEAEQALYDATPMIPVNIFSSKSFFRIHEVEEYEKEMRAKLKKDEKPTAEQLQKQKQESDMKRQRAMMQMNQMIGALNPINYQFTGKDLKSKSILQGLDGQILIETTKSNKPIIHAQNQKDALPPGTPAENKNSNPKAGNQKNDPSSKQPPKTSDSKNDPPKPEVPSTAKSRNLQSAQTGISGTTEKPKKEVPALRLSQVLGDEKPKEPEKQQLVDMGNLLELKTIEELNLMQAATVNNIINQTQKKMNYASQKGDSYQYQNHNPFTKTQFSHETDDLGKSQQSSGFQKGSRTVVKNSYMADYGSYLLNAQLDYNTPQYYHQREAEQGLFYLSKQYRDYFEPARDVFAEKEGWDILNKFAHNPKNTHASKPAVHNYAQGKQVHDKEDILTAFQGLQTMHELNQVAADINQRNDANLHRKIVFNQL